jgi:hypothetical protein
MDRELRKLRQLTANNSSLRSALDRLYHRINLKLCPCICGCLDGIILTDIFCDDCLEDHWPHSDECNCEFCDIPVYHEWGGNAFLELHANRTINKIDLPEYSDLGPNGEFFWSIYSNLLTTFSKEFQDQTGEELHFLGRSDRHVCVADTLENRDNYEVLRNLALELEKELIKRVQEFDFSP